MKGYTFDKRDTMWIFSHTGIDDGVCDGRVDDDYCCGSDFDRARSDVIHPPVTQHAV